MIDSTRYLAQVWRHVCLVASLVSAGLLMSAIALPSQASAECMWLGPWPSFERSVRSAEQILVGEVTESLRLDEGDRSSRFRFRVDEVLRGTGPSEVLFDGWAFVGHAQCDKMLSVRLGDRLVLAIDKAVGAHPQQVTYGTVAFLNRDPSKGSRTEREDDLGLERMSLRRVRELVALPETDAISGAEAISGVPLSPGPIDPGLVPILALVVAAGVALWLLPRRLGTARDR